MSIYPKQIKDALAKVRYPGTGKDLVTAGMVEDNIRIEGNKVSFSLLFEKENDPFMKSVIKAAETAILTFVDKDIDIKGNITPVFLHSIPKVEKLLPEVKNIIAISSEKEASVKAPSQPISPLHWLYKDIKWDFSMRISSDLRNPRCSIRKTHVQLA